MQYVDCDRAEKHGNLCLGYGYEEIDEPCEQCQSCIKCEGGSYQLGETEKDDQLTKAKELLEEIYNFEEGIKTDFPAFDLAKWSVETRKFLKIGDKNVSTE